jgi:hypothetical protein
MKKYKVNYAIDGEGTAEIVAEDKEKAEQALKQILEGIGFEFETGWFNVYYVKE